MRKSILVILLCLSAFSFSLAQESIPTAKVVNDNFQQLQVAFSVGELQMDKIEMNGQTFTQLSINGLHPSLQVGAPNLPTWSSIIEVPLCSGYEVEVSGAVYDTLRVKGEVVAPLQPSYSKSDREVHPLTMDERIYNTNAFFSAAPLAMVEAVGVARDRNLARLQFSPVSYNPVSGEVVICRSAIVTVRYTGADEAGSLSMFERYYSPMFGVSQSTLNSLYPKSVRTTAPVRYLIVAHSMFRGQLDEFVQWKKRKGFITDIVYTDNASVGSTSTSIAAYIQGQYDNATSANPAPTYLLIVGDHEQIPAFTAQVTSPSSDHITDLYYASWTSGDHIPDCYMGRFSAQNVSQLTPQIEKTLMYEQYTFADPSFLDRAVMVAGVDGGTAGDNGYRYGDPAMDYAVTNYVNGDHGFTQVKYFKNDLSIVPSATNVTVASSASSNSATVRSYYNEGAGWINYSAHGSATSWGTPNFTTTDAASMTNNQKFGIMIGNCCLTNRFQVETCLGESLLRKGNYCGAVGYIGGSNSTYWGDDFYWAVGVRSSIGPTMSMAYNSSNLGGYDRIFHTHSEARSQWVTTQGELVFQGNMAVESSGSSYSYYYWEIYHLMGDPSLMPYLTQAPAMNLTASSMLMLGTSTLSVTAAPYAYVALTDTTTHTLCASGYADASGNVTLSLPSSMQVGFYELAASAQQYRTAFQYISVVPASGPYPVVVSITPTTSLNAGSTVPLNIKVANLGSSNASGVTMSLSSDNQAVSLSTSTVNIGSIASGDTVTITTVSATALQQTPDATHATVTAAVNWSGSTAGTSYGASLTVNAAAIEMTVVPSSSSMLPDSNLTVTVTLTNNGHANLGSSQLTLTTGNQQMSVQNSQYTIQNISQGATLTRQFQLHASASIDTDIYVPIYVHLGGGQTIDDTLQIYIGINSLETFEGGQFQVAGWTQGSYPWAFTSEESYEGSWSARSTENLGSNNTSELTIIFNVALADSISYYYKVSSEASWDKFHCYLDGVEMNVASGDIDWTRDVFPVSAGNHTLLFTYAKDGSVNSGSDCAWIDNISLPHGARATSEGTTPGGGDDPGTGEPGTFENLIVDFNSAEDDSRWTLLNGGLTNAWTIGTTGANGAGRGLYISNDGGQTNAYTNNSSTVVFAYTTLWLDTGEYNSSFDWRCNGESTYDFLRVALVPTSVTLTASNSSSLPTDWSTTAIPSGAIALDGGNKLNLSSSWSTRQEEIHVSQSGWYNYVLFWRNDYSMGNNPPAAVDNIRLLHNIRYNLNVTTTQGNDGGTTIGSGSYLAGEVATVGVFPNAGYTFVGWNDGNGDNPRQYTVNGNSTLQATLAQNGEVVVMHDTTFVEVFVEDTPHDTVYVEVYIEDPVHDTTIITLTDTVTVTETIMQFDTITVTEYVPIYDTTTITLTDTVTLTEYVDVFVHDTTTITLTDTVTLTEYVPVHDTTFITQTDTLTLTETVTVTDTITLTEYVPVHDTTFIYGDTVTLTEYVPVHDTTFIYGDTVTLMEYVPVHDTTIITQTDTITLTETVTVTDTITLTEYVPVHDTTTIMLTDTVTLTEYIPVHDTTTITLTDTVTLTEYIPVHDTTFITQTDTITLTETVTVTDTITLTEYVDVFIHDTTTITLTDTVTLTEYIPVHDTTFITQTDTITLTETVTVTDTITLTEYVDVFIHDTTTITLTDTLTINNFIYDTTYITDSLWIISYDTIYLHDTILIHDTIYITQQDIESLDALNLKIYAERGQVVVEGAEGGQVMLFDVLGRMLATKQDEYMPLRFDVPASGTYLIKVGNHQVRKLVVIK